MGLMLFTPTAATVTIAASSTTDSVALASGSYAGSRSVRICNLGAVAVFLEFGESDVEATTGGIPVPPGHVETMEISKTVTHVAAITASDTADVYFTIGQGA